MKKSNLISTLICMFTFVGCSTASLPKAGPRIPAAVPSAKNLTKVKRHNCSLTLTPLQEPKETFLYDILCTDQPQEQVFLCKDTHGQIFFEALDADLMCLQLISVCANTETGVTCQDSNNKDIKLVEAPTNTNRENN
jgi:hypothetical protein